MFACMLALVQTAEAGSIASSPSSLWVDYVRTLLVLAAVCLAALFTVRVLLPRLAGFSASAAPGLIQVLARRPLEPKKTLYLVRAGKSVILLATSADTVQPMATLDGADFPETAPSMQPVKPLLFQQIARMVAERDRGTTP